MLALLEPLARNDRSLAGMTECDPFSVVPFSAFTHICESGVSGTYSLGEGKYKGVTQG